MSKIAIVTSESGTACAYSAGALLALIEKFQLTDPAMVIGSSGSTGSLAYFVARQYRAGQNIWQNLLSTPKFVSLLRLNRIMDIDYLVDEVFKKQEPLDLDAIRDSKITLLIAATNLTTGRAEYFSNQDDVFEALRASSAVPVFFGKKVKIGTAHYVDGAITASVAENIEHARGLGANRIIAIDNSHHGFFSKIFFKAYNLFHPGMKVPKTLNDIDLSDVMIIRAGKKLPIVSDIDMDRKNLIETMKIGYNDIINSQELAGFIKN